MNGDDRLHVQLLEACAGYSRRKWDRHIVAPACETAPPNTFFDASLAMLCGHVSTDYICEVNLNSSFFFTPVLLKTVYTEVSSRFVGLGGSARVMGLVCTLLSAVSQ